MVCCIGFWTQPIWAQKTPDPCKGEENQNNLNACAQNRYEAADAELNRVWKSIIAELSDERAKQLRDVQRLWLKFRDAHCAYQEGPWNEGSMRPMIHFGCLRELTEARTAQLKTIQNELDN